MAFVFFLQYPSEQRYQSKAIRYWVEQYLVDGQKEPEFEAVLQEFPDETVSAISQLIRKNRYDSIWRRAFRRIYDRLPRVVQKHVLPSRTPFETRGRIMGVMAKGWKNNSKVGQAWTKGLITLMQNPTPEVRSMAVGCFYSEEPLDIEHLQLRREVIEALAQACSDSDSQIRWDAIWIMGQVRPLSNTSIAALTRACRDPNVSRGAALALSKMGVCPTIAVPILAEAALTDHAPLVRAEFLRAIGNFGSSASFAVPDLEKALSDKNQLVRDTAKDILTRMEQAPNGSPAL